eukprot:m.129163 g.129163  ORF g.129163 m.129163 type:complete len:376 (-) comp29377_c0_seq1:53-1180(-)
MMLKASMHQRSIATVFGCVLIVVGFAVFYPTPQTITSGTSLSRTPPLVTTPEASGLQDPKSSMGWPSACPEDMVPVIFPNSTEIRTTHMIGLMQRIGGCGRIVDAVMQQDVQVKSLQANTNDNIGDKKLEKWMELHYDGEIIFNSSVYPQGNFPRGNRPNAATHFRMFDALAHSSHGYPASSWAMMMEDDAQLHADLKTMLPTPTSVAAMLKWSFEVANARKDTLISYGVCKGKQSSCTPIDIGDLQDQYPGIQMATCTGDVRCAATYAIPKWRAREVAKAYATLNSGSTNCASGLMSTNDCGRDPFGLVGYLGLCGRAGAIPCTTLVVGYNFVSPTSGNPDKPNHLGAFIQEKRKGGIGHIVIRQDLVDGLNSK